MERIEAPWTIGETVYHRAAEERSGIVTGILVRPGGIMLAEVSWGDGESGFHFECELTNERDWGTSQN